MKSGMAFPAALAAVMLVSAACGGEYDDDLSIGSLTSELRGGYVTVDCGWPEDVKLRDAHNVLFDTITIGYSDFLACMSAAPSVEFICHNALNPVRAAQKAPHQTSPRSRDMAFIITPMNSAAKSRAWPKRLMAEGRTSL